MTSKRIEDVHKDHLHKLLLKSGLECLRSPQESFESETLSEEAQEQEVEEEAKAEEETILEQEETKGALEESQDEISDIFPTPSLRRVLPERIRNIEEQNRINVLPKEFNTNIDPTMIPKIAYTAQKQYIDILAAIVGCDNYKSSLAEFWFLDTLANLLRRAQDDGLDRPTQAVLILWFCEWMKEMQHFDAADRERMLRRFQDNMLSAAKFISKENRLPVPADIDVLYKASEDYDKPTIVPTMSKMPSEVESKYTVSFEGTTFECSLMDLTKIIHYIFDLFSSDYQFNLVQSVFTFTPDYILIDSPYQLQNPKRIYTILKAKPKKDKPKKDAKSAAKGKKKESETEEFLALMELKAKEEREQEEIEERDREDYNKRSHILPLGFAATDELFDKYWPPPTPEPDPEPEPETKGKGKGKGKK